MSDPFELGKSYDWRKPHNNSRGQNTARGAAVGTAEGAAAGAVLGGVTGARRARAGVRDLKRVGAGPSRTAATRIAAGHGARVAGRGAVGFGALGAVAGTYTGLTLKAKRKAKVQKNDRRMDPAPATARLAGALPKHSPEAQAVAQAAATKRKPPVAAAIRGTLRATTIAKSEDPFQPAVAKSAFGERGDKRNTTYAAAGFAGSTVGSGVGRRLGAKAAGTSMPGIYAQSAAHHLAAAEMGIPPERGVLRSGLKALKGTHGAKSMMVGDLVGSTAGAAAGAAAVHRRRVRRGIAKSAFGVEHPESVEKKKIPAVLPGEKVAPRGFEPRKLPAAAGRGGAGRGTQGQRRAVRSGKV